MSTKRVRYNWLFIIQDNHKLADFDHWRILVRKGPRISLNRLARAYVLKFMKNLNYKQPCYILGHECSFEFYNRDVSLKSDEEFF